MAHEVTQGPHPFLRIIRVYGDVDSRDMTCFDDVGLTEGHPIYLLTNLAKINVGLPDKFLETLRNSVLTHPNLAHDAIYLPAAPAVNTLANMAVKFTRSQKKVSLHLTLDGAQDHLVKMIQAAGL